MQSALQLRGVRGHGEHVREPQICRPLAHFETLKGLAALYRYLYSRYIWHHMETCKKKKLLLNLFLFICRGVRKYLLHVSPELWLGWFIRLTCLHINKVPLLSGSSRVEEFGPPSVLFSKHNGTFDPRRKSFTGMILA